VFSYGTDVDVCLAAQNKYYVLHLFVSKAKECRKYARAVVLTMFVMYKTY